MGRAKQGFAGLSPAQRSLAASVGSLHRWSRSNSPEARRAGTQAARDGRRARIAAEIDPTGALPEDELNAAVDRRIRADMRALALKSAKSRKGKAA